MIIVAGTDDEPTSSLDIDRLLLELSDRLPGKEAAKVVSRVTGAKRNDLYARILALKDDK